MWVKENQTLLIRHISCDGTFGWGGVIPETTVAAASLHLFWRPTASPEVREAQLNLPARPPDDKRTSGWM